MRVVAKRRYRAPRERVFRAFTDPKELARWFSPSEDIATDAIELDLRVGGAYRFGFHLPDGFVDYVLGRFEEVSPPRETRLHLDVGRARSARKNRDSSHGRVDRARR